MGSSPRALARLAAPALARAGLASPGTGKGCHGDSPWESRAILDLSGTGESLEPAHRKEKGGHFLRTGLGWQIKLVFMQGECRDVHSAHPVLLSAAARSPFGEQVRQLLPPLFLVLSPARGRNWLCLLSPSFPVPRHQYVPFPPASPEHKETHGLVGKAKMHPTAVR